MPEYTYEREDGTTFNVVRSIKDEPLEVCPETGQKVTQVIGCPVIIDKTPRTVGSYAEANTKKIGKTKIQEDQEKYAPPEKPDPWFRKGPIKKALVNATEEQRKKYVLTGKI